MTKFLLADLAYLYLYQQLTSVRQDYEKASEYFEQVCFKYADEGWHAIDVSLVEKYTICQRQLNRTKNLLQSYVYLIQHQEHLKMESLQFYFQQFRLICESSKESYKSVDCNVIEVVELIVKEDYSNTELMELELGFLSHLPENFQLDNVSVTYSAGEGQIINFCSNDISTNVGLNTISCHSNRIYVPGIYAPTKVSLQFQQLELQFNIPSNLQKSAKLRIFESRSSLKMFIKQCKNAKDPNMMQVIIETNAVQLENPILKLNPITDLKLEFNKSLEYHVIGPDGNTEELRAFQNTDGGISIQSCFPNSKISFSVTTDVEERPGIQHTVH